MKLLKKNSARVFWVTTGVAVAALVLLLVIFNVIMGRHIQEQARRALAANAAWMRGDQDYDADVYDLFVVNFLYLDEQDQPFDAGIDYYYDPFGATAALLSWQAQNRDRLLAEAPCAATLNGQSYYVQRIELPEFADYAVAYEDGTGEIASPRGGIAGALLYVNVTPWSRLWSGVNLAFAIAVLLFSGAACAIGLRTGMMIENSEARMKRFFQNASHELKTPITSIEGYAEGIATGVMPDAKAAAEIILCESERMRELVEELLCLSRIDSGAAKPAMEKVELSELIYGCLSAASGAARRRGVALEAELPEGEITLVGDEKQLARALGNLLTNGVRYARTRVSVGARTQGRALCLTVSDDGGGIDPADLNRIFERFYCGRRGGTGIGLALAREIALLHKGSIHAENGPEGAIFTLSLPLAGFNP